MRKRSLGEPGLDGRAAVGRVEGLDTAQMEGWRRRLVQHTLPPSVRQPRDAPDRDAVAVLTSRNRMRRTSC